MSTPVTPELEGERDRRVAALDALELACGIPLGSEPTVRPLVSEEVSPSVRRALETVVLEALRRPPCVVSFSGGRDSSAVLAIATMVARREALPDPLPVTNRFPAIGASDETDWQELVIGHLRLREWERLELTTELDIVGELARGQIARHGILAPFNGHFHLPLLAIARGGSLLTGIGGDELFEPTQRAALLRVLHARPLPSRRQLRQCVRAALPRPIRFHRARSEPAFEAFTWLTEGARSMLRDRYARWTTSEPIGYRRALANWWWPSRMLQTNLAAKRLMAADLDVHVAHPLADPRVMVAYGASRGAAGPPGRVWALRELLGGLLPEVVIERTTKSTFTDAFWTHTAREFARNWIGTGIDPGVVEPEELRREWLSEHPDPHTFLLMQSVLREAQAGLSL